MEDTTMEYIPPYAAARKTECPKIDKRIKSLLEGGKRERELITQLNYPLPRRVKQVGMTTGGKVWEERGGAQINEYLFW
jgi:hypothetical protein